MRKKYSYNLFKRVARQTGFPMVQVKTVIVEFIRVIITELANGRTVYMMSLGKFWLKPVEAKKAWNWRKKLYMSLPHRMIPKFKFSNNVYELIRSEASKFIEHADGHEPRRDDPPVE